MNRRTRMIYSAVVVFFITASCLSARALAGSALRDGSRGTEVVELQKDLTTLGYLEGKADGVFGKSTSDALKKFQTDSGLKADGVFGSSTKASMQSALEEATLPKTYVVKDGDSLWTIARTFGTTTAKVAQKNGIKEEATLRVGTKLTLPSDVPRNTSRGYIVPQDSRPKVELIPWEEVNRLLPIGGEYVVTDVETGKQFTAVRRGGHLHADSEPKTHEDVETLKAIFGGSWSWNRRAVIVHYGGRALAASINGMPHGSDYISGNGFDGMFCIHFLGSRIHQSGAIDPAHQAMVRLAARYTGK